MNTICLIGAGQLGSRHLQALKAISVPLNITVVDPFPASIKMAKERYESAPGSAVHSIKYGNTFEALDRVYDVVIIATNSDVRSKAVEQLFSRSTVRFLILEKILFQKYKDYKIIGELLKKHNCKTWVDCSMRTMPFYYDLKNKIRPPITYCATGSQFGLITTGIHYIDHMAYLTGCYDYKLITDGLEPKPVSSKRLGFLELNGTLAAHFNDGSFGAFTCFSEGNMPVNIEIHSTHGRVISRENEQKAWRASQATEWLWQESAAPIPFQSQMTAVVIEDILKTGHCELTPYEESAKLHLTLLEGLSAFLSKHGHKTDFYPFT